MGIDMGIDIDLGMDVDVDMDTDRWSLVPGAGPWSVVLGYWYLVLGSGPGLWSLVLVPGPGP